MKPNVVRFPLKNSPKSQSFYFFPGIVVRKAGKIRVPGKGTTSKFLALTDNTTVAQLPKRAGLMMSRKRLILYELHLF